MKCHICDNDIADAEIVFSNEAGKVPGQGGFEPCGTCLNAAMDAAYSQGFHKPDEDTYTELGDVEPSGDFDVDSDVETLDSDAFVSTQYDLPFSRRIQDEGYD